MFQIKDLSSDLYSEVSEEESSDSSDFGEQHIYNVILEIIYNSKKILLPDFYNQYSATSSSYKVDTSSLFNLSFDNLLIELAGNDNGEDNVVIILDSESELFKKLAVVTGSNLRNNESGKGKLILAFNKDNDLNSRWITTPVALFLREDMSRDYFHIFFDQYQDIEDKMGEENTKSFFDDMFSVVCDVVKDVSSMVNRLKSDLICVPKPRPIKGKKYKKRIYFNYYIAPFFLSKPKMVAPKAKKKKKNGVTELSQSFSKFSKEVKIW